MTLGLAVVPLRLEIKNIQVVSISELPVEYGSVSGRYNANQGLNAKPMMDGGAMATGLLNCGEGGGLTAPSARIIDRTAPKRLPIGDNGFEHTASSSVFVDRTTLIADVLDSGLSLRCFAVRGA